MDRPTQNGQAGDQVRAIHEDRDGRLWIATYGRLSCIHNTVIRSSTVANGLPSDFVRSLHEDADGVLWVGTYGGGIARWKKGRITAFTSREGLPNDLAYAILKDDFGMLWVSCNQGVYRVAKRELDNVAEHRAKTVHSRSFTEVDGLPSRSSRGNFPSGCRGSDGRLWFATLEGLACVDPSRVAKRVAEPPRVVESIVADGQEWSSKVALGCPPGPIASRSTTSPWTSSRRRTCVTATVCVATIQPGSRSEAGAPPSSPVSVLAHTDSRWWHEVSTGYGPIRPSSSSSESCPSSTEGVGS